MKRDTPPPPLQQQQRQLPYNRFQPPPSEKDNYRINDEIRGVKEVRLIGDNVPEEGIYSFNIALEMAEERELDLVEIARNATPPVCRIIDYTKFLYDKKRRDKEIKQKAQKTIIKEIRFTPETDDHDIEFKTKHAERFLEEGAKVKAYVSFKGRGILFKDRGELLLLKFADKLKEHGSLEQLPKLEGKRMFIFITPKKKK
ncbi:MAG TPA: translation initiation factor IF-3 [Chitinophagales bacterium]|nr:translation initiation factor IF-3 [Chitinophagales bacterium]